MEKKHFWHVGRKEIIHRILIDSIRGKKGIRMLELGCGNGNVLRYLKESGIYIEGGDVSIECLQNCKKMADDIPIYHIHSFSTPFRDESFDIVGIFDVIEHVDDIYPLLRE